MTAVPETGVATRARCLHCGRDGGAVDYLVIAPLDVAEGRAEAAAICDRCIDVLAGWLRDLRRADRRRGRAARAAPSDPLAWPFRGHRTMAEVLRAEAGEGVA